MNKSLVILAKAASMICLLAFFAVSTQASFNPQINYQGKLTDASNNVVTDGSYNFRFRLCTASLSGACSGSVVMDETYIGSDKVSVASGLFSVMLGSVSSTLSSVDFNQDLYLEVQVGGSSTPSWETLSPIKRLGSVPSAFNAQKFDGLATTSFLRSDITNLQSVFTSVTTTNSTTTGSQYIGGNLVNGTLNGLAQWFNGLASVTTTPTVSGMTVTGASSLATLTVSSNATTTGYLTVGTAPTGADFSAGSLNVQSNGMFGGYVSSTGDLHTSANLTVQGTSDFTGLVSGAGFTSAFDSRISGTWRGIANGLASLGADGKVPIAQLSPLTITDTFVTSSEAGMLALDAQVGDVAIRLDESKSYILRVAGPTVLANWAELVFPTDAVRSVNTKTGDVTLSTDDINIGLTNFYYTEARFTSSTNAIKAQPNGLASLGADGIIPAAQIGSMFLNDTFVFAATSSLLTSGATKGDIGISTDQSKTYVLKTTDPTAWANWAEILNGSSVISVNGFTGAITLTTSNITEGANQYWTQGRFDTALAGATTWTGDLFVSSGNVGIGIATTSNALEVVGNASTSNHMYVGNDLYVGYSNGANSDKIYFAQGAQSLIWNVTNSRFEFSDGLYVTNNLSVSGSASSTALHVTGNATTTGYLTVGAAPSGANFTAGSLNVQDKLVVPYVSSTALTVSGNAYITGTVYAGVNNSSLGNLTSYGDSGANGGKLSLFYGATRAGTYQYWLMQPGSEVSADRFWLGTNLNNNLFTFTGGGDLMLNSGRLAVGTTTPYSKLTVWGTGTGTNKLVEFVNSASTTVFSILENGSLSAGTSTIANLIVSNVSTSTFAGGLTVGTSQFVVQQATGNVGVGKTAPVTKLDVVGTVSSTGLQVNGNGGITGTLTVIGAASASNLSGTNTGDNSVNSLYSGLVTNATHTGDVTGSGALTIANDAVTFAKMLNGNYGGIIGRNTAGAGDYAELSTSTYKSMLALAQADISGLTTASSPTFNGLTLTTDLSVANGGTGASTLTGLLQGNGTGAITGITGTAGQFPYYSGTSVLSATSTIFLATTGNIGIGKTVPATKLDVAGTVSSTGLQVNGNATTTGNLSVGAAAGGNSVLELRKQSVLKWSVGNNVSGDYFTISTSSLGTNNVLLISSSTGGLGIGTGVTSTFSSAGKASRMTIFRQSGYGIVFTGTSTDPMIYDSVSGAALTAGGQFVNASSRELKENFVSLSNEEILKKISGLQLVQYDYKIEGPNVKHFGAMADDWYAAFGFGNDNRTISPSDVAFVTMQGLKALYEQATKIVNQQNLLYSGEIKVITDPDANIDSLVVRRAANFYGTMTVIGESNFISRAYFRDQVYFNKDSAGRVEIPLNANSVHVSYEKPYAVVPIVTISPAAEFTGYRYWTANETVYGFDVMITDPAVKILKFNWHAVAVSPDDNFIAPSSSPTPAPASAPTAAGSPTVSAPSAPASSETFAPPAIISSSSTPAVAATSSQIGIPDSIKPASEPSLPVIPDDTVVVAAEPEIQVVVVDAEPAAP